MQKSYDLTQSLFSAKAREGMIAFAGFRTSAAAEGYEGVLKIAAFHRPEGGGYLTLTFLIDLEGDDARRAGLQARFRRVDQDALAARLSPDFQMVLEVMLNSFSESSQFYIEELNLYFHRLAGHERRLLEEQVIPALSQLLDFTFDPIDWLAASRPVAPPVAAERPAREPSLKERIKEWLGLD